MTTDMKTAIERVRHAEFVADSHELSTALATVLDLAEIGRLAVEWRAASSDTVLQAQIDLMDAADAFPARREGGK